MVRGYNRVIGCEKDDGTNEMVAHTNDFRKLLQCIVNWAPDVMIGEWEV